MNYGVAFFNDFRVSLLVVFFFLTPLVSIHQVLAQKSRANIVVEAARSPLSDTVPALVVVVDGQTVGKATVLNSGAQKFYFRANVQVGSEIDIVFLSPSKSPRVRDASRVSINSLVVNEISIPIDRAIYDQGSGEAAFDGKDVQAFNPPWISRPGALRFKFGSGLNELQMGLVINDNDPYSVAVGNRYASLRKIPQDNIIHVQFPVKSILTRDEFAPVKMQIDSALKNHVQGIALAWTYPWAVECNSITNAISLGFNPTPCEVHTCISTPDQPLYSSTSLRPFTTLGVRPSMLLGARTLEDGLALVERGNFSDATKPSGSAYLMKTSDNVRNVRANPLFDISPAFLVSPLIKNQLIYGDSIQSQDILFYFQGLSYINHIAEANVYLPGAIADNFTSFGGRLNDSLGQTSILDFISAGATGSFGTVSEPCSYTQKFSDPRRLMQFYSGGRSLIESYWKSVQITFQGLFVGEPLANPWKGTPNFDEEVPTQPDFLLNSISCQNDSLSVRLDWRPSTDNVSVGGYYIYRGSVPIGKTNGNTTTFLDSTVVTNQSYEYTVSAFDGNGNESAKSKRLAISIPSFHAACTPDFDPPSTPENVTFSISCQLDPLIRGALVPNVNLSWTASSDDVEVIAYKIYRDGSLFATRSTTSFFDQRTLAGTSHDYAISAIDFAGHESAQSSLVSVTIPPNYCVR